ncbi:MAG TPA: SCO3374 family protein, partial [Streptomyces sp.]|nr:SCO3374 family protein [Streptomyces sp.]
LEWLEWGTGALGLDLTVRGAGDALTAPLPPGTARARRTAGVTGGGGGPAGGAADCGCAAGAGAGGGDTDVSQGAAVWLRPPEPGGEVEASLPTLSAVGGGGDAPDLVRLVDTVAAQCHRVRLRRACAGPPAWHA